MDVKIIVTHTSPDLDAVAAVWIFKRFLEPETKDAEVVFVNAGDRLAPEELRKRKVSSQQVVHVDTGLGEFDHHSEALANKKVCAASLVHDKLIEIHPEIAKDDALARLVEIVIEVDHFGEFYWPEPNHDRYLFFLDVILKHLKSIGESDDQVVELGMRALDAVYAAFRSRVSAEAEVASGVEFETKWGKGLGMKTSNDDAIKYAQKKGYMVVVRKDPDLGSVRIKAAPGKRIDLTEIYEKIRRLDRKGTWYFHPGKTMLLNGSSKRDNQVASELSLEQVIEIFEQNR